MQRLGWLVGVYEQFFKSYSLHLSSAISYKINSTVLDGILFLIRFPHSIGETYSNEPGFY